jgi:hypothetical protein
MLLGKDEVPGACTAFAIVREISCERIEAPTSLSGARIAADRSLLLATAAVLLLSATRPTA